MEERSAAALDVRRSAAFAPKRSTKVNQRRACLALFNVYLFILRPGSNKQCVCAFRCPLSVCGAHNRRENQAETGSRLIEQSF